ncbi:MAG: molybdopterin-guanine dinucleotide biosynthesis protein MobB, partial [Clostridia bacterium]|nr:molybdopterin-guanine dinucleotide biosynthesis protein MobB [Clostridia bacterium]
RHYQAGADVVTISSASKFAMIERREEEYPLDEIIAKLPPVDLILTEGFRRQNKPKIEVYRAEAHAALMCEPEELIALVSDTPWGIGVQCFALEDYEALADFVEKYMCEYIVK